MSKFKMNTMAALKPRCPHCRKMHEENYKRGLREHFKRELGGIEEQTKDFSGRKDGR